MLLGHHLVIVMEVKPRRTLIPQIIKRLAGKTCICGCGGKIYRNGLSRKCHYAMERELFALSPDERPSYINKRIRLGEYLTAQLVRVFGKAAKSKSA